jgi:hypothetical protein
VSRSCQSPRYNPMANMLRHLNGLLNLLRNRTARDSDTVRQVQLSKGRIAYLRLGARRDRRYGYKSAEVSVEPPALEKATVAALVALEGRKLDPRRVRRVFPLWKTLLELQSSEPIQRERALKAMEEPRFAEAALDDVDDGEQLECLRELLRHYRLEFDSLEKQEQIAFLERAVIHVNEYLEALGKLIAFLQYGDAYSGLPTNAIKNAQRNVRAAELKDIVGLSNPQVGEVLELRRSEKEVEDRDHKYARDVVKNGRNILKGVLGEGDYQEYVNSQKEEAERFRSLSGDERFAELAADALSIPADVMRRFVIDEDFGAGAGELNADQVLIGELLVMFNRMAKQAKDRKRAAGSG